jgi:hypothetical protein
MTVNSRASNARERGYAIEHRHDASAGERGDAHLYRLHGWFPPHEGCGAPGVKHLPDVGFACKACHIIRRDLQPAAAAQEATHSRGLASAPASGPGTRGGSSETDAAAAAPAERAPAHTGSEVAGSTPAPRSSHVDDMTTGTAPAARHCAAAGAPRTTADVVSLLEWRGFLEATDERIAELEPDPDQASLFDELEEVA